MDNDLSQPSRMKQSLVHVALVVRDYDEAISFFCDKLHFVVLEDTPVPEQNKRWVVVAPPGSNGTSLVLARPSNAEQEPYIGNQTGGRVTFFLNTDDFRRDYERMVADGIRFVREPKEAPYGTVAVFEDLYGNLWDLLQLKAKPHPSVVDMWRDYWRSIGRSEPEGEPFAWYFCDNEADADECARLALDGIKRATASSLAELKVSGDPVPRVGDLNIVTNWAGVAQCVIRTTAVETVPFHGISAEQAAVEGEGDRSLEYWRRVHRDYYTRVLEGTEHSFSEEMLIAFERFEVVYPKREKDPPDEKRRRPSP